MKIHNISQLFLLFLTIFLLIGCTKTQDKPIMATTLRTAATGCENIVDINSKQTCLLNKATANNDTKLCEVITNTTTRSSCIKQIAVTTSDATLCAKLANSPKMDKDICYGKIAGNLENSSLCKYIEYADFRIECTAILENNLSMCDNISNQQIRDNCKSN